MPEIKDRYRPYQPVTPKYHTQMALKALFDGSADSGQQKLFVHWLLTQVCDTYGMSYFPDSDRDTAFAEGKRYVGNQLLRWAKEPIVAEDRTNKELDPHEREKR